MIDPSPLNLAGVLVVIALSALLGTLMIRRRNSRRAYVGRIKDRRDRLELALWATGERYWDYELATGQLRRVVVYPTDNGGRMVEDSMPAENLLHPDDLPLALQTLQSYLKGESDRIQAQLRLADSQGNWIWMRVRGRAIERNEDGRILRIGGTALNITATREAERERQIAATVLRSMGEAVAVMDARYRYISVNPAFLRMSGYTENEVLGRSAALLASDQNARATYRALRAQAREQGHWSGELWQRRKNGEELLTAVELRTVRDAEAEADATGLLHVAVCNDITRQKRTEDELRYLANFDTLTGLPNRALLSERLSRAVVRAQREDSQLAVLFLDLDRFKDINDSLGHAAGDRILRAVAMRLRQTVGDRHTVARLAGDEFTVVIEDLSAPEDAERIARAILDAFDEPLQLDQRREMAISPSIGISVYPDNAQVPSELLKQADTAMYQAKAAGRRTYMRYDDSMDLAVRHRATVSSALRKVLDRGELRLVFQPRMSLSPARITGVEALLRWTSPEHGDISPGSFIPIAEESGLILEIGQWVLREACLVLQRWRQHGLDDLAVSVNVSMLQLLRGDLPGVVADVLRETGIPPHLLELELTESVLMANAEQASERLQVFRALGVSLAIDDFGTGYSSLAYLKRLPITTIKIDKAFVDGLPHDNEDAAITPTIVAMGHSLGLRVVAEGVETAAQMRFLDERGCDEIQGYWVSRPLEALQCLAFIRNWSADSMPPSSRRDRLATLP